MCGREDQEYVYEGKRKKVLGSETVDASSKEMLAIVSGQG